MKGLFPAPRKMTRRLCAVVLGGHAHVREAGEGTRLHVLDGGVEVGVGAFGEQIAAFDMHIAFSALASLLFLHVVHCQQDSYIHYLVEMPGNPIQLAGHVTAQGGGDFKMVAADRQIHRDSFFKISAKFHGWNRVEKTTGRNQTGSDGNNAVGNNYAPLA